MDSFEDAGLEPELVDTLSMLGIEQPTEFQEGVLPVIRRGNNVVARAGSGAGILVAYGAALLDRLDLEETGPLAVVLTATRESARRKAESLAHLATGTGHTVASLGGPWVLAEQAHILFATPRDLLGEVEESRVDMSRVISVIVDEAHAIQASVGLDILDLVMDSVPGDGQRVLVALPLTDEARDFAKRHMKRAVSFPPTSVEDEKAEGPDRGAVDYRVVSTGKEDTLLELLGERLGTGEARHALVFFRSPDEAVDVGDYLTLHGFVAGPPGDEEYPVWLGVDDLSGRNAMEEAEDVVAVSYDVPAGPDSLDRRHGGGAGGMVLILPRELPHLRDVARRTGYGLVPSPPPGETRISDDLLDTLETVETALEGEDIATYMLLLETLFERHDPAEVAAAAVALLRKRGVSPPARPTGTAVPQAQSRPPSQPTPAWVKLFVSLGKKDDAGPGDLLGAITGEADVQGDKVGRIDIKETFSIVEVDQEVADRVIEALNGTTVCGRSLRVDFDRPRGRGGKPSPSGGAPSGSGRSR